VIGLWALSDPGTFPAPANSPSAFNTFVPGLTQLNAVFFQGGAFRLGLFDLRGDGRPDYRYHARVFYGDNVSPARVGVSGGTPITIQGLGFHKNLRVSLGGTNAPVIAVTPNQALFAPPPKPDGIQDLVLTDAATGASSTMTGVITYGAGPNDLLKLIAGANPTTPVGGQAPNPMIVQVTAPDGLTPVVGASVVFTSNASVAFAACSGATTCTVPTDQSGRASTYMIPVATGVNTVTAALAPASYNPAQQVQTTLFAAVAPLSLSLASPNIWAAQGATLDVPIAVRALSNGSPMANQVISYSLSKGTGTLNPPTAATDNNGNATTTLHLTNLASEVDGSACATAGGVTNCQNFAIFAVPAASLQLQIVSGTQQQIKLGQNFQPLVVHVTDSSTPPNSIFGAPVIFQSVIGRAPNNEPLQWIDDLGIMQNPMPVILGSSQVSVISDANGLASIQPSAGSIQGPVLILGTTSVGNGSQQFVLQSLP
jgi:hypothetical protein